MKTDIIIIGGGVNSLVTAALLGQAGKKVLLLEERESVGGMATTADFAPGFKCNMVYDEMKWIDPRVVKQLKLEQYGLEFVLTDPVKIALDPNGKHISFYRDLDRTAQSIAVHSEKDAKVWKDFSKYINNLTQFLEKLYELTPPKLPKIGLHNFFDMSGMIKPMWKHGTPGLAELMHVFPMNMNELTAEWFENPFLKGTVSTAGIRHISYGPYSAGTGYNLLHQHLYCSGVFHNTVIAKGGTKALANALKTAVEFHSVVVRTNAKVSAINLVNGVCTGITLQSGESLKADIIVSGLDPRTTFLQLIGAQHLNPRFTSQLKNIKYRGSVARIHFALKKFPEINGVSNQELNAVFCIVPGIEYLERAADAVKYGEIPEEPFLEFSLPSIINTDFAPPSKHVLSATVQYAPYHLKNRTWNDENKQILKKNVVGILEKYIPEFSSLIETSMVLSPKDLENQFGLTEGNLNHGEMTLDQFFFMRPTMSTAQYITPVQNLFLCGPGTHPGGGLHGMNGFNAAREILKLY